MLSDFDSATPFTLTLASAAGGISGFASSEFAIDTSAFANDLADGDFSVQQQGNNLLLVFVPEPGSSTIFLVGAAWLLGGTRRRRRMSGGCVMQPRTLPPRIQIDRLTGSTQHLSCT